MVVEDDKFVLHGPEPFEPFPNANYTVGKLIFDSLLNNSCENDVMVDAFTNKTLSYKTLLEESCNLAAALRSYNYSAGTIVAIFSENNLEFPIPLLASLFVGSIIVPINFNYTPTEAKHILNISKPKVIFCSEDVASKVVDIKDELSYVDKIVIINSNRPIRGTEWLKDFIANGLRGNYASPKNFEPFQGNSAELGALILCSSGTTGLPKGVLLSQRNILTPFIQSRDPRYEVKVPQQLGLLPFFHSYGLMVLLVSIFLKRKIIVMRKFHEDIFLRSIQDYKPTIIALVPPLVIFLEKSPKVLQYDLSSLEYIGCGAAPLNKQREAALKKRLKNLKAIFQGYGLTEATLSVTKMEINFQRSGSCGKVLTFMKLKIRDPISGKSLGPNQVGEICIKGPSIMMGYYNDENSTKEAFTSDGWLKSGDLGYYDNEEYVYIVDRLKELIKYKGYQVAPAELEAILLNNPKVRDVGVVGVPDEMAGELPLAFVVKHEGAETSEKELQQYVAGLVSPEKKLRGGVIFVKEIPKNPSGKILRRELRQKLKYYKNKIESKL